MAEGIKDKVAILGMGCTNFGQRWDCSAEDLMIESFIECLEDAGIEKKEIQAAYFGSHYDEISVGKAATPLGSALKFPYMPITRTENYCATATEAFRAACYAVAAGAYDIVLIIIQGLFSRFTNSLEAREMNDGIGLVLVQHPVQ